MAKNKKGTAGNGALEVFLFTAFSMLDPIYANLESAWYGAFASIWGWDQDRSNPVAGIRRLRRYVELQSRKPREERHPYDPELQLLLGVAYLSGWIPCEDPVREAEWWISSSAEQESPRGLAAYGYLIEKKLLRTGDEILMLNYYTRAAEMGSPVAQHRLARYLYRNRGCDPMVRQLLEHAANAQYTPAKELLAEAYPETVFDLAYRRMYGSDWAGLARKQQASAAGIFAPRASGKEGEGGALGTAPIDMRELAAAVTETHHIVKETRKEVAAGNRIAEDTQGRIVRMEAYLQSMKASLDGMWADLRQENAGNAKILRELQQTVNKNLRNASRAEVEAAEEFLASVFGGDWRNPARLCSESCDALVAARVLRKAAADFEIRNYAGIVITAVWAMEHECRRRFYDAFTGYLKEQKISRKNWPVCLRLGGNPNGAFGFSLGSIEFIVQCPEFEAFARDRLLSEAVRETIVFESVGQLFAEHSLYEENQSFVGIVRELVTQYRNKAAHGKSISRTQADACYSILGIAEDHLQTPQAGGALKLLLRLTKPLA